MQKFGWFGGLGVTQGHQQYNIWYRIYDFLFDFNRNYASILYRFWVIVRFSSKWPILTHPMCIGGDPVRISPWTLVSES